MFLNGYNATGIKEITSEIGIPKGSFYNHFSSKEEFGLEVVQNYCNNGIAFYRRALLNDNPSPIDRLNKFFTEIIDNYNKLMNTNLGCIMSNFSAELGGANEAFRELLDKEFEECESVLLACLDEAQEKGEISGDLDTKLVGAFLLNSWHGAIVRMKSTGNTKPLEDFKSFIFQQLSN